MMKESERQYRRCCALNGVAVGVNVLAIVVQLIKGRWWITPVHILMIALVTRSFLSYRKAHLEFRETMRKIMGEEYDAM